MGGRPGGERRRSTQGRNRRVATTDIEALHHYEIYQRAQEMNIAPRAYAALDIALGIGKLKPKCHSTNCWVIPYHTYLGNHRD